MTVVEQFKEIRKTLEEIQTDILLRQMRESIQEQNQILKELREDYPVIQEHLKALMQIIEEEK